MKVTHPKVNPNCSTGFNHNSNEVPITRFCNTLIIMILGIPSCWEGEYWLKTTHAQFSL